MKHAKWLILICLINFAGSVYGIDDAYCNGFFKGFSQRYCLVMGKTAADALPPVCPDPVMGADSGQDGYNRGFTVGLDAMLFCQEGNDSDPNEQLKVPNSGFSADVDLQR
jgi:hypothetical protein